MVNNVIKAHRRKLVIKLVANGVNILLEYFHETEMPSFIIHIKSQLVEYFAARLLLEQSVFVERLFHINK